MDHDCVRLADPDPSGVAADEHMRERSRPQNFLHGGNAAAPAQTGIDDHQVRPWQTAALTASASLAAVAQTSWPMPASNSERSIAIRASSSMTSTRCLFLNS